MITLKSKTKKERILSVTLNACSFGMIVFWGVALFNSWALIPIVAATINGFGVIGSCAMQLNRIDEVKSKKFE